MRKKKAANDQIISVEVVERRILLIRGHKVMLDSQLAELYEVPTYRLNEAVKRHRRRFPEDFRFQLTKEEAESLTSQFAMSGTPSGPITSTPGRGGRRTQPYVFTEQGVAMLSSVLNSERAIAVNIAIIRTFVRLRQILSTNKDFADRVAAVEKKFDRQFKVVFDVLRQLTEPAPVPPKRRIGFSAGK